ATSCPLAPSFPLPANVSGSCLAHEARAMIIHAAKIAGAHKRAGCHLRAVVNSSRDMGNQQYSGVKAASQLI
ncbi:MAG: hypothetical protein WBN40_10530, partial [Pseudomonadales bacterium]